MLSRAYDDVPDRSYETHLGRALQGTGVVLGKVHERFQDEISGRVGRYLQGQDAVT